MPNGRGSKAGRQGRAGILLLYDTTTAEINQFNAAPDPYSTYYYYFSSSSS